jgi:hypothetical protein
MADTLWLNFFGLTVCKALEMKRKFTTTDRRSAHTNVTNKAAKPLVRFDFAVNFFQGIDFAFHAAGLHKWLYLFPVYPV